MPADLKAKWKTYREKLRDFPATMAAASVTPNAAFYMMPNSVSYTHLTLPKKAEVQISVVAESLKK